jgi:hypothetical protein
MAMRESVGKRLRIVFVSALLVASASWIGVAPGAAGAVVGAMPASANVNLVSDHGTRASANIRQVELGRAINSSGTASLPASASGPKTAASCSPLFTSVASGNSVNIGNQLVAMAALNPKDIWAVGFNYTSASNSGRTLAARFDGVSWQTVPTPNFGNGINFLNAVAANDPNDVWAVGNFDNNNLGNNLAIHWNGSGWGSSTVPQPSASDQFLSSVSALAPNNVWAVGSYLTAGNIYQAMALQWNGSNWASVAMPNAGSGDNIVQAVFARTATDIWAVGTYLATAGAADPTTNPYLTLVEHWNGSAWAIQSSPNPLASADNELLTVDSTSATDAWAVGFTYDGTVRQTLTEHLVSGTWTAVASPNVSTTGDSVFFGLDTISATNAWATGYGKPNNTTGGSALAEHWDGSAWTMQTTDNPGGSNGQELDAVASLPGNDVWAVGGVYGASNENTLAEQFQLPPPSISSVTPSDQSATITWTVPAFDCGFTTTGYVITAADGCTVLGTMPAATSPATFTGLTNGSPVSFTVQAVSASLGAETPATPAGSVIPAGGTTPVAESACSSKQYQYSSPNAATFVDMDTNNLALSVTPSANSVAVISGNSDLWTANAGLNQDIGVFVSGGTFAAGQVVAWKESGGFAGTFSPNAAAVQAVVPMTSGIAYTVKLQWKSNKAFAGANIFAGAGPLEGDYRFNGAGAGGFSPTRLSLHLVAVSTNSVDSVVSTQQYHLTNSNGTTFMDIDGTNLSESVPVAADSVAVITGNSDLWTANAGFNQDIGISVSGGSFGTGQLVGWKESGGFAGTFSPNAAFVQAVIPLTSAGSPYTVKLQWKTNKNASDATIYAGAGPWPSGTSTFSPTRLTVWLLPAASVNAAVSTSQYSLASSDGAGWLAIDSTKLQLSVSPASAASYEISANADLWTANAGFNQDLGVFISGGIYGTGTLIAWKESGGFAGTFSPNAAFVATVAHLQSGVSYTVWLAWKTNKQGAGSTIFVGAGPIAAAFSPTRLTAIQLSTP